MNKYYKNIFNSKRINGSASLGAADPFLIKVNGYYYLTCTRPKGLVLMKSFDLIRWKDVNEDGIVGLDDKLYSAYAPEIAYINGSFYACTSPSGNGHYLYKSDDINGPFERISENINELIDGSFFLDSDLSTYFLRATETGIVIKHFANNQIEGTKDYFDNYYYFKDSAIGNWTEGPYLIKRYGKYYLTFTGTHFLSDAYRVNYSSGNSIKDEKSLIHQGILLISTKDDFYGLGHSMNILGPNLDSYYIAYHNMMPNKNRYLNLTRLVFDNEGHMSTNGIQVNNNLKIERPYFEEFINEENYLSKEEFIDDNFSIEYNFKSQNIELILGYKDDSNYQAFKFIDDKLMLFTYRGNNISQKIIYDFRGSQDFDKYHSIRIQYKKNRLAIYFDLIELDYKFRVHINNGRIGFRNNKLENAYIAYSKYSFGSSDIVVPKVDAFYLNNMNKNDNVYSTKIYINEEGYYDFFIDNNNVAIDNLMIDRQLCNVNLLDKKIIKDVYLRKGFHNISFKLINGKFNSVKYYINKNDAISLDTTNYLDNMILHGRYLRDNNKIYFENDRNALLTKAIYEEYEVSTDLEIVGLPIKKENVVGLLIDVNNYAKVNQFESVYSFQGYGLLINKKNAFIVEGNYYHTKILKTINLKDDISKYNLKIIKEYSKIKFYIDNTLVYEFKGFSKFIKGKVGLYMNHASVIYHSFNLIKKEEI